MNILIADDHANVRRGLRELLADSFPDAHFSEAAGGDEVLSKLIVSQPDILLLDINMPGRNGFEVLKDVKQIYPLVPVIMVSVQAESQYAQRCRHAGASDYVNKDSVSEELAPAIRKILEGTASLARAASCL
jgi:DNA-binding NarL/FixJ family response regulator